VTLKEQKAEADRKYFEHVNTCPDCKKFNCKIEKQLDIERKALDSALLDEWYWNQGID